MLAVRQLVKRMKPSNMNEVAALEEKLERCRTQENNPLSELYVLIAVRVVIRVALGRQNARPRRDSGHFILLQRTACVIASG